MKVYDVMAKMSATTNAKIYVRCRSSETGRREEVYIDRWNMLHPQKGEYPFCATVTQIAVANNVMVIYATVK